MPTYEVTVRRSECITFRLDATDPDDAEERALQVGEEVGSYLTEGQPETVEVVEVSA